MNISGKIKEQRARLGISQEELADKIYVTRQTVSSWENNKSYPDVHSLVLLSTTFEITVDALIKGDLVKMEAEIKSDDVRKMNTYSVVMGVGLIGGIVLFALSWFYGFIPGIVLAILVYLIGTYYSMRIEKLKKQYDVQTYREILAFSKGETLDEIAKIRESGKVKYQKIFLAVGAAVVAMAIVTTVYLVIAVVSLL